MAANQRELSSQGAPYSNPESRGDDLTAAVGFIPRFNAFRSARVAERRMNLCVTETFNRHYTTGIRRGREPWVETHGYRHEVAPRPFPVFPEVQ